MPMYEYKCSGCGDVFEIIQKFADEPLTSHDKCGGRVERLLSAPALQFKGTGWYVTDYAKSGGNPSKESKEAKESKADTAASAAKTDSASKPDSGSSSSGSSSSGSGSTGSGSTGSGSTGSTPAKN
ncbi:MAG: FmdB family zinc ribbon protein [Bryobacteraceae bacterium]